MPSHAFAGHLPVADAIRDAILRGEFAPNQRLIEADLSERFSASRGSVRVALLELTNEGLVERTQHRGARVRAVRLAEAIEITEVRAVVEGLCAAKAAHEVTDEEIAELRELGEAMRGAVADGDTLRYSDLNHQLHRRIREISTHAVAANVLERLGAQSVRHQFRLAMLPGRPKVSLGEHLDIVEAICVRDAETAEKAARRHLLSVIETLKVSETAPLDLGPIQ